MSKVKNKNMTVWLQPSTIAKYTALAKNNKRSRNYVIARILEGVALSPKHHIQTILDSIECKEIKCQK